MRNRTRIACIAVLAAGLWACDNNNGDTDAGTDAGHTGTDSGTQDAGPGDAGQADGGTDAGSADSGPPEPTQFGIRLANMVGGLTPNPDGTAGNADDNGAIELCLDSNIASFTPMHLTQAGVLPYGGVSPYLAFPYLPTSTTLNYTVTIYDAASFPAGGCPDDTTDPTALVQSTITGDDVAVGEFHTALLAGWTAGGCTASGIDPCPEISLAIHQDDLSAPAAGKVRVSVANGVSHASGAVDVCVVDMAAPTEPPVVLATGVDVSDISDATEIDPIAGSDTTFIVVTLTSDTPCTGARVGLGATPTGIAGTVPTNAALVAAGDPHVPATYDADTSLVLFLFPVGGGLAGTDPLAVPWIDTPDPADLL